MDLLRIILDGVLIAALIVLALLARNYLPSYLRKKGENLATKEDIEEITQGIQGVKSEHAAALERLRADLNRQAHMHSVHFEKEFETLSDVWAKLVALRDAAASLRPMVDYMDPNEPEDERKKGRLTRFAECHNALAEVVHKSRPFYPQKIFEKLIEIIRLSRREAIQYRRRSPGYGDRGYDEQYWEKAEKNVDAIMKGVDEICDAIRHRVVG